MVENKITLNMILFAQEEFFEALRKSNFKFKKKVQYDATTIGREIKCVISGRFEMGE